jgi:hypothetical protein
LFVSFFFGCFHPILPVSNDLNAERSIFHSPSTLFGEGNDRNDNFEGKIKNLKEF